MSVIGDRLRETRVQTGLSAEKFGAIGGVKGNAQYKYESGERSPDSQYLELLAGAGYDVLYIISGRPDLTNLDLAEQQLLAAYRAAPPAVRAAALAALLAGTAPTSGINQNIQNFQGITTSAPVVLPPGAFSFGSEPKKK